MGYRILDRTNPAPCVSDADVAALCLRLVSDNSAERQQALSRLIALDAQDALVGCLASPQAETVRLAGVGLWECWLSEAGPAARRRVEAGIDLMNAGHFDAARATFETLVDDFPCWAEAHNKLATAEYLLGNLSRSIERCHLVIALKPDHFGAWNGLAICAIQREDWPLALRAVEESLRLQPHSSHNRQLLHLVKSRLQTA